MTTTSNTDDALAFSVDAPHAPVPCQAEPERWMPDLDSAPLEERRYFRTKVLPQVQRECNRCHFRIRCAVYALESRADCGVWAGVETRWAKAPDALHRRRLMKVIAEYLAAPVDGDSRRRDVLRARIDTMLQRRPELQAVFEAAVAAEHGADTEHAAASTKKSRKSKTQAAGNISADDAQFLFDSVPA